MLTAAAHILDSIANPVTETLKTEVSLKPSHWIRNNKTRSKLAQQTSDKIKVYLFPSAPSCIVFFFHYLEYPKPKFLPKEMTHFHCQVSSIFLWQDRKSDIGSEKVHFAPGRLPDYFQRNVAYKSWGRK